MLHESVEEVSARLFERGIQLSLQKPTFVIPRQENIKLYEEGYRRYLEVLEEAVEDNFEQKKIASLRSQ